MRCLSLLLVLVSTTVVMAAPQFESYSVTVHRLRKFAQTRIPQSSIDWKMERCLRESDKQALNFSDKYTLVEVGCGTGCSEFCLIDRSTGKVHPGMSVTMDFPKHYEGLAGFEYRRDSRLLIVRGAYEFHYPIFVNYYLWSQTKFDLLQSEQISEKKKVNAPSSHIKEEFNANLISDPDKKFLAEVLNKIRNKDTAWIARNINYPISVSTDKGKRIIRTKEDFEPVLRRQLTDKVIAQIAADARRALFKNWQGLMVGDGIVWFTELGTSTSTPQPEYILLALGMFAFQTEWTVSDGL
jgi:hypothetical protein